MLLYPFRRPLAFFTLPHSSRKRNWGPDPPLSFIFIFMQFLISSKSSTVYCNVRDISVRIRTWITAKKEDILFLDFICGFFFSFKLLFFALFEIKTERNSFCQEMKVFSLFFLFLSSIFISQPIFLQFDERISTSIIDEI